MRFDGYRFKLMGDADDGTSEMRSERIQYLYAEKSGNVWVATTTRLFRYASDKRRFRSFPLETQSGDGILGGDLHGIFESADGTVWVVTESGLCRFLSAEEAFVHYPYPQPWEIGISERFSFAEAGSHIWMNVSGNIFSFDRENDRISMVETAGIVE